MREKRVFCCDAAYGIGLPVLAPGTAMMERADFGMAEYVLQAALLFRTDFPPEAYELPVKELSRRFGTDIGKTKTVYDVCSLGVSVVLSLCFFGGFVGVNGGTPVCTAVNGRLIGRIGAALEARFEFRDAFPLRERLQQRPQGQKRAGLPCSPALSMPRGRARGMIICPLRPWRGSPRGGSCRRWSWAARPRTR